MKRIGMILALTTKIVGCGASIELENQQKVETEEVGDSPQYLELKGYISSAFDVVVDNRNYPDSEEFYTQQVEALESEMVEEGLEEYSLRFEAEVGLLDLKKDMRVFAVPEGSSGYAGESQIMSDGTFYMMMPPEAEGRYQVRANKRINAHLTSPEGDVITWCYNFYGYATHDLHAESLPMIIKEFTTRVTKYKCRDNQARGIKLPVDIHLDTDLEGGIEDGEVIEDNQY